MSKTTDYKVLLIHITNICFNMFVHLRCHAKCDISETSDADVRSAAKVDGRSDDVIHGAQGGFGQGVVDLENLWGEKSKFRQKS